MADDTPLCIADFERKAQGKLTQNAWNYYASGADGEQTLSENVSAYERLRIRPHMLRGISEVDTTTEIFGQDISLPICIAPSAMQKMAHPDGEIGSGKAAQAFNTCMGLSTLSTVSYEELVEAVPNALLFMQLYVYKNRDLSTSLIRRAEKAGFKAIALTIDTPMLGKRIVDQKHKFKLPDHLHLGNFADNSEFQGVSDEDGSGLMSYVMKNIEPKLSSETVAWLQSVTNLPILLKGILTAEDAVEAVKMGVQGIIVSNHGGRQLDGVPSTIEALPEVVAAVDGKIDVFIDGGIRKGTDVFKAIALGAKAVFIGRPVLWGLSYNGEEGVKSVLEILKEEFERAMILSGCANLKEIVPSRVVHESFYWKLSHHKL